MEASSLATVLSLISRRSSSSSTFCWGFSRETRKPDLSLDVQTGLNARGSRKGPDGTGSYYPGEAAIVPLLLLAGVIGVGFDGEYSSLTSAFLVGVVGSFDVEPYSSVNKFHEPGESIECLNFLPDSVLTSRLSSEP